MMQNKDNSTDLLERKIKCLSGTFAAEGMTISQSTLSNIERIAQGKADYHQVIHELNEKYGKKA